MAGNLLVYGLLAAMLRVQAADPATRDGRPAALGPFLRVTREFSGLENRLTSISDRRSPPMLEPLSTHPSRPWARPVLAPASS